MTTQIAAAEFRRISKRFGGVRALSDLSVTIRKGEVHALVGENGAGKSTAGRLLAGILQPSSGEILIDGHQMALRSPRDALAAGVAIVAQELALLPARTVLDNVFLGHESASRGVLVPARLRERYDRLTAHVGMRVDPGALVRTLPLADQQKVEILRALARDARVLILDEPTAALDRDDARGLLRTIRGLARLGTTVIFVSHFLADVLSVADTITVLRDGRHVMTGPAAGQTLDTLVTAMLGRSLASSFPHLPPLDPGAPVVLDVRGLGRRNALHDVSMTLRRGEIVGLGGLVGSGRTEVARALFGAEPADTGAVLLDRRPIRARHPADALRLGLAMLPENRKESGLLLGRSIQENVTLPRLRQVSTAGVIGPKRERRAVLDMAARVTLGMRDPRDPVRSLSGGNQQKVMFARWLLSPPRVLLADEPTRGVDVGARLAIYELLVELAAQGLAILLISAEPEELLALSHRIVVMRGGTVAGELDRREATEEAIMRLALGADRGRAAHD